jgi:hypothetical protein
MESLADPATAAVPALISARMETSRMKPFTTPEISATGIKVLRLQCEGVERRDFRKSIQGCNVIACAMPEAQTLRAAWLFQVILDDGRFLEFSSACTEVVDWQEVGSLNIRLGIQPPDVTTPAAPTLLRVAVPPVRIDDLDVLVYEDEDVISECGLAICEQGGQEIVVAAGIPPGSVSITTPFSAESFEPQFSVSACTRVRI